jgi:hypothetical protein
MSERLNSVYVLRAVNTADFNEHDVVVVGATREAVEKQFRKVLKDRYENHLDADDIEFYGTLEKYIDSWNESCEVCGVAYES